MVLSGMDIVTSGVSVHRSDFAISALGFLSQHLIILCSTSAILSTSPRWFSGLEQCVCVFSPSTFGNACHVLYLVPGAWDGSR